MQKIIMYGIGNDFHAYFNGTSSLYRNMIEEMGITVTALCDSNQSRFGEKIYLGGDRAYELKDIQNVSEDS